MIDAGAAANFPGNSASFKFKQKITRSTGNDGTKNVRIIVTFKYLSNFWRTLEMLLVNCEINLILSSYSNCVISNAAPNQAAIFAIKDTKLYVPVVTLSAEDNFKSIAAIKIRIQTYN